MKLQICLLALLSSAGVALAQGQQIDVQMIENGETSLTANWNGNPLTTTLVGPETWDVSLASGGYVLDGTRTGEQISWVEPGSEPGFNVVTVASQTELIYQSDVPTAAGYGPYALGVSLLIGSDIAGSGQQAYAQVFDNASAPDSGTSASLLGMALLGLGMLRSKFGLTQRK